MKFSGRFPKATAATLRSLFRNFLLLVFSGVLTLALFALAPVLLNRSTFSGDRGGLASTLLVPLSHRKKAASQDPVKKKKLSPKRDTAPDPINRSDLRERRRPRPTQPETNPVVIAPQVSMPPDLCIVGLSEIPDMETLQTDKTDMPAVAPAFSEKSKHRFTMDEVDRIPLGLATPQPPYPYRARRFGMQGYVKVRFLVDVDGTVSEISVLEATPEGIFEETVQQTVPEWRFKAAVKNGRLVDSWVQTTIEFTLGG